MNVTRTEINGYLLIRHRGSTTPGIDRARIRSHIERALAAGHRRFAVSFDDREFLFSEEIAVLVTCGLIISDAGGEIVILAPTAQLVEMIETFLVGTRIRIARSEDDLIAG